MGNARAEYKKNKKELMEELDCSVIGEFHHGAMLIVKSLPTINEMAERTEMIRRALPTLDEVTKNVLRIFGRSRKHGDAQKCE